MNSPTTTLPRLGRNTPVDDIVAELGAACCAGIERLVDEDTISAVPDELAPNMEETQTGADELSGELTRRTGAVPARSPASWPMIQHRKIRHRRPLPGERRRALPPLHGRSVRPPLRPGRAADPP